MNFNEEQLNEIAEMAGLFFDTETIGINMEMDEEQIEDFHSAVQCIILSNPLVAAYYRGRLSAQVSLRAAIRQSAANGSSPSQQTMLRFMNESEA